VKELLAKAQSTLAVADPQQPTSLSNMQEPTLTKITEPSVPISNVSSTPIATEPISTTVVPPSATIEYPGLYALSEKIAALDKALVAASPGMDSLLQTIHRNLDKDPELVHLLKEEEISVIFRGLERQTQTTIVSDSVKSAGSGKNKGLSKLTSADLGMDDQ
jgi:hypothetical protein